MSMVRTIQAIPGNTDQTVTNYTIYMGGGNMGAVLLSLYPFHLHNIKQGTINSTSELKIAQRNSICFIYETSFCKDVTESK